MAAEGVPAARAVVWGTTTTAALEWHPCGGSAAFLCAAERLQAVDGVVLAAAQEPEQ